MIAAALAAAAVLVFFASDARATKRVRAFVPRQTATRTMNVRTVRIAFVLAGLACGLTLGGVIGWIAGAAIAVFGPIAIGRLQPKGEREREDALVRQAPNAADLLAACIASGASMRDATQVVASACDEPMRGVLRSVVAALELGASSDVAWADAARETALAPMAHAVMRSANSGAPLAELLTHIAEDLRRERRLRIEVAARSAGVKAVAPLAACFLPAFLLLSVVPIVVDLGGSMLHPQG